MYGACLDSRALIVWSGWGILVVVIAFAVVIAIQSVVSSAFGFSQGPQHRWTCYGRVLAEGTWKWN